MSEYTVSYPLLIVLVGMVVVTALLTRSFLERVGVPPILGFLALGIGMRFLDLAIPFRTAAFREIFGFLARVGVITLLFRIGLESKVRGLLGQLRWASLTWLSDISFSGLFGYLTARYLLGMDLIHSLVVAIALTATSVGISLGIWKNQNMLNTRAGQMLTDVAELDDISGITLMALLFSLIPVLRQEGSSGLLIPALASAGGILLKLVLFGGLCVLFSLYVEQPVTAFFSRIASPSYLMLLVTGIGFMIAATAGLIGFSVAIGAFFAGLAFSRDPASVKIDASFDAIYDLFSPFFFVGIGLSVNPDALSGGLAAGLVLLAAAVAGKMTGFGIPASFRLGASGALLLGVSMVPRAEISMIIMERGLSLGDWAVHEKTFAGMVLVSAATCLITPMAVQPMIVRWKKRNSQGE